jgi:hypothetical protein
MTDPRTGGANPAAFREGRADELVGRGAGHSPPRYGNQDGKRLGDGAPDYQVVDGLADRATRQIDTADDGENRGHIGRSRDEAMRVSRKTGSLHPAEHAGWLGKGRW